MSSAIITPSASVKKGIFIINEMETSKFSLLLSRILKSLRTKEKPFTSTEEEKLQTSLSLGAEDITLLLDTIDYILKQAAYHLARPSILSQQLLQLEISEEKVKVLVEAWTSNAKSIVKELAQLQITPLQLEDVNWRLHLRMAQATKSKMGKPTALLDFLIRDDATGSKENVLFETSHEELYAFYNKLDDIQEQLDSLR